MALTFEQWMAEVDRLLDEAVFLSSMDLPDWRYRDAYDEGMRPKKAAALVLRNAGWER